MSAVLARARALLPRRSDWSQARPLKDLTAGLMVGLVALPLALGFGQSAGLGAGAGVVTAIVAGTVAAVFGGSRVQVSGPTGAMTVVLVPIVARYGVDASYIAHTTFDEQEDALQRPTWLVALYRVESAETAADLVGQHADQIGLRGHLDRIERVRVAEIIDRQERDRRQRRAVDAVPMGEVGDPGELMHLGERDAVDRVGVAERVQGQAHTCGGREPRGTHPHLADGVGCDGRGSGKTDAFEAASKASTPST